MVTKTLHCPHCQSDALVRNGHAPISLPPRALLHRLLGGIPGGHPMPEQHTAVGKETGETAHVERWNNALRQRLARFVRMTSSSSSIATIPSGPSCSSEPLP